MTEGGEGGEVGDGGRASDGLATGPCSSALPSSPSSPSSPAAQPRRPSARASTPASTRRRSTGSSGAWRWWTRAAACSTAATRTASSFPPATRSWWSARWPRRCCRPTGGSRPASTAAGGGRRAPGRPGALRPGRSDYGPPLLRHRHHARRRLRHRPVRPAASAGRFAAGKGVRRSPATWWATAATSSPPWSIPIGKQFDLNWWYAAPVSGLGFNDNSVDFTWQPGPAAGAPAAIIDDPRPGRHRVREPDGDGAARRRVRHRGPLLPHPGTLQIWAEGTVALDNPPRTESFALPDPEPLRRASPAPGAGGRRNCGRRHHPFHHRFHALRRACGPLRRWPRSPPVRSGTGSFPSSIPVRTGSPRCC